eukprot:GHVT01062350.1.p1 GENE.GHVT01062350.1~~GHVT01062350.1.p1  ORF type:complete len:339 (+),score=76.46 GHVT01062350.1:702-1718(+)
MNGIIHPCCHPEDSENPENEGEMFRLIFQYIDRIFALVRPRKLLYMAIDGVAPRAKMNQQRARRFKAAQEVELEEKYYQAIRAEFEAENRHVPAPKVHWDSNVITPGTPFMDRLAQALRYFIAEKFRSDNSWRGLKVILSDANSPGEGEHKIMDFVRRQRSQKGYDPNLRHVLHGADADLIFLGLATHEASFFILREMVTDSAAPKCANCGRTGHDAAECRDEKQADSEPGKEAKEEGTAATSGHKRKKAAEEEGNATKKKADAKLAALLENHKRAWKPMQFLLLPVLREYLTKEFDFKVSKQPNIKTNNKLFKFGRKKYFTFKAHLSFSAADLLACS